MRVWGPRFRTIPAVECSACQYECAPGARFCSECGAALSRACSSCGAELAEGARFCAQCGTAAGDGPAPKPEPPVPAPEAGYTPRHLRDQVLGRRDALEGERKFVTVMFVDIQGSVEATSQIDSEEWHSVMDRFFGLAGEAIHRFDGTINQYTGDGVMALFGAPLALEDHAQCACDAALALQEAMGAFTAGIERDYGVTIGARVGLHSGEVVVASIGVELRRDYTAQGRTVGIAARMEALAGVGEVYVTPATASLARDRFFFESLGQFEVKGVDEPMEVLCLLRALGHKAEGDDGGHAFFGREHELEILAREMTRVRGGSGRAIGIVGDAGLGKSRLVREFIERAKAEGFSCHTSHCSGQRGARAFEAIVHLAESLFGLSSTEDASRAREVIGARMAELGPDYAKLTHVACDFLNVTDPDDRTPRLDPAARRRQLAVILRALLDAVANAGPGLIVFEDVHWIDDSSLEVLPLLVDHASAHPLLFVFSARPGFSAPWMGSSNYQQIPLDPLGHDACDGLIADIVGDDPSTLELQHQICVRAAGNPLFVEHVVHSLVENGVLDGDEGAYRQVQTAEKMEIPPSVRALLSARVDRLQEVEKRVLHVASLIGGEFDRELVEIVADVGDCGSALDELLKLRLLEARSVFPIERYEFHHPLVRETAEQSQLRERRREIHGRIAEALLARFGRAPSENSKSIASHLERAGRKLEAVRYLLNYGSWLYRLDAPNAFAAAKEAQALADSVSSEEGAAAARISCRIAVAGLGYQGALGADALGRIKDEVEALCGEAANGPRSLARIYDYYGQSLLHDGRGSESAQWLVRAQELAQEQRDHELYFTLASSAAFLMRSTGDSTGARAVAEEALCMPDVQPNWGVAHHGHRVGILLRHHRASTLCDLGEVREGLDEMSAALADALEAEEGQSHCWQVCDRVWLAEQVGGSEGLEEIAANAVRWAEDRGGDVVRTQMLGTWATLCRWTGRFEEAVEVFEKSIEMALGAHAVVHMVPQCLAGLAEARIALGDAAAAHDALAEADKIRARLDAPNQDLRVLVAHARVQLADPKGDRSVAASALGEAEKLVERLGLLVWHPGLLELRAALADATGRHEDRDEALAEAARLYARYGDDRRAEAVSASPLPLLPD